ncbi:MAG: hypothetical protein EXX96DRAFT_552657 [Benjaminiella poitrasii]|nr:MAG: hypothetical protein EXX96DRAFT_552657 [Benjaminiella poitrasii]
MRRSNMKITRKNNPKLKIHLENDQLIMYGTSTESSGCVLRGALSLQLNKPTKLQSLILSFHGTMSVSWSQLLGNGYERKYRDQQILINHTWTFLSATTNRRQQQQQNNTNFVLLEPGNYTYDFELVLPGSLPESTHVAKYYVVQYQLKATAKRSNFLLSNYTTRQDIHLSRQKLLSSLLTTDYFDPITVANQWADKLDYEISIPTKVYSPGDTIPISIRVIPLAPHLRIRHISCTFKEYMTCRAINGWFNGKNKLHGRIIQYIRKDYTQFYHQDDTNIHYLDDLWSSVLNIQVPGSLMEIQCDAHNESVRVRHKLKFTMSIENNDGHISELRAILPLVIAINNSMNGLPAYGEIRNTLPYDPALMMTLLRRSNESATMISNIAENMGDICHYPLITDNTTNNGPILPSYSSIYST